MKPLVSVIINSCNSSIYVESAIDSVLRQSYQNWEIIFLDNQSTDGSCEIVKKYGDPRIRIYTTPGRIALGAARNQALGYVNGHWIAFLDTDDLWHSDKLNKQIDYVLCNPQLDFIYTNYANIYSEDDVKIAKPQLTDNQPNGDVFGQFLEHYPVNLQTVLIRAECLLKMPELFPSNYEVAEEYDLFLRYVYNRKVGYLNEILVYYRLHPAQQSRKLILCYALEIADTIKKLKVLHPESVVKYSIEYARIECKLIYYHARAMSQKGEKSGARKMLQTVMLKDWRLFLMTILLCLPGNLFGYVHKKLGRYY